jgi:hypothetical protein
VLTQPEQTPEPDAVAEPATLAASMDTSGSVMLDLELVHVARWSGRYGPRLIPMTVASFGSYLLME